MKLSLECGAGKEVRTLDLYLGKVSLYQLSYSRMYCIKTNDKTTTPNLEREKRFELSTYTLARYRSTS